MKLESKVWKQYLDSRESEYFVKGNYYMKYFCLVMILFVVDRYVNGVKNDP